jgi:hypothetical protein
MSRPNPSFLHQLEVFHAAFCKITKRDKNIREYYLERTADQVVSKLVYIAFLMLLLTMAQTETAPHPK